MNRINDKIGEKLITDKSVKFRFSISKVFLNTNFKIPLFTGVSEHYRPKNVISKRQIFVKNG